MTERFETPAFSSNESKLTAFADAWRAALQRAIKIVQLNDTEMLLPDKTIIKPHFTIRSLQRPVLAAGNIMRPHVCYGMNEIAKRTGIATAVVKGTPANAEVALFTGTEPNHGWERSLDPASYFTPHITHTTGTEGSLQALLNPYPGEEFTFTPPTILFDTLR